MSVTGENNVLVAYCSLANNQVYTTNEMDAVSSASLKIEDGTGYGHAELLTDIAAKSEHHCGRN